MSKRPLKLIIWERDNYICRYCDRKVIDIYQNGGELPVNAATVDHVFPVGKGGSEDDPDNMVTACHYCNNLLGDDFTTIEEKRDYINRVTHPLHSRRIRQPGRKNRKKAFKPKFKHKVR
jgi:5-methylcytosine-specific restriction endonuclease McrA